MKHTQEEIIKALQIIKDECKGQVCHNCIFCRTGDGVCGLKDAPAHWQINKPEDWKALK